MDAVTIASIIAAATPLVYASLGETISEKAGIVNLSLDGTLLLTAMVAFATAQTSGSVLLGFLAAAGVGVAAAAVVAFSAIELKLNQIAVGFVLFLLASDLATLLGQNFVREPGPSVTPRDIPGLADIPWIGTVLFAHNLSVYGSIVLVGIVYWYFYTTRPGLELQAVGERPEAGFARGIDVQRLRYVYALVGGAFVGLGGAAFSLDVKFGWSEGHVRNFGWIALAIVIFGGWHPVRVALGCYLFGALQVIALKLQPTFPSFTQVLGILPFPLMILTLVAINRPAFRSLGDRLGVFRRFLTAEAPGGLGTPFEQG